MISSYRFFKDKFYSLASLVLQSNVYIQRFTSCAFTITSVCGQFRHIFVCHILTHASSILKVCAIVRHKIQGHKCGRLWGGSGPPVGLKIQNCTMGGIYNPLPADSFSKYKTKVIPNKVCIIKLYTIKYSI